MPKYTPTIDGIPVNSSTIVQAVENAYPGTFSTIRDSRLYAYLTLFGIRVSTCDTGQPDDFIGGIRLMPSATGDYWQIELSEASVDPSPNYVGRVICNDNTITDKPSGCKGHGGVRPKTGLFDAEAKSKGGTAWFKEGKYPYLLTTKGGYPAFRPSKNIPVWRWNANQNGEYFSEFAYGGKGGGVMLVNGVEVETGNKAINSDVTDTMIHMSWSRITRDANGNILRGKFTNDSAGCQIFENNDGLKIINGWAKEHLKKQGYPNYFMYCLINKPQFLSANQNGYKQESLAEKLRQSTQNWSNILFGAATNLGGGSSW